MEQENGHLAGTPELGPGYHVRMRQPWRLASPADGQDVVRFYRLVYDAARRPLKQRSRATLDFSGTPVAAPARRALVACVRLGKIDPEQAGAIVDEFRLSAAAAQVGAPATLRDFLSVIGKPLLDAFDDPMRGVLTTPLYRGLFGAGTGFVGALDRLAAIDMASGLDTLGDYVEFYLRCRRAIIALALSMGGEMPAFTEAEIHTTEDFFVWWRRQWTQSVGVHLPPDAVPVSLPMPASLPKARVDAVRRAVTAVAREHARLARALGSAPGATQAFVLDFTAELFNGLASLLLNGYGGARCPRAETITATLVTASGYPTPAKQVKRLDIGPDRFSDVYRRFFAERRRESILPLSGQVLALTEFGACPFPDHGYTWVA
jgi:hypothetical protein